MKEIGNNEILSAVRQALATKSIQQKQVKIGWSGELLSHLRRYLQASVATAIIIVACTLSFEAATRHDTGGSGRDIEVTESSVRYMSHEQSRQARLAFGSRPQDREESGVALWGVQQGDWVLAGGCRDSKCGNSVSGDALYCLSQNIFWEARDQSLAGQLAVAQVTMNRVRSDAYPNTVCGVVYEHKQFSWYWDGKPDVPKERESWESAQLVASAALAGSGHAELMDVNILHYHAVYVSPYWAPKMELVARIGDHIFYDGGP